MSKRGTEYSESDVKIFSKSKVKKNVPPESNSDATPDRNGEPQPEPEETEVKDAVKFDPEALYYDMSGNKLMFIFNHIHFEANDIYGEEPPEPRKKGTTEDVDAMDTLFSSLGFNVKRYEDKKYIDIHNILKDLCAKDHSATSCLAVVIMTHGYKDGILCAYDQPYLLPNIIQLFEDGHHSLINKPKLFFIQALEEMSGLRPALQKFLHAHSTSYIKACRGELVDSGKMTTHDGRPKKSLHVPTHIEFLVARSSVEDYRAWREDTGSWFIQELCYIVKTYHKTMDLVQLLTLVTRRVAYVYKSHTFEPDLNRKKETPETRFTLTKLLKF